MDSWYRWADELVEGGRQWRSYELGALKGRVDIPKDDLPDDYPYHRCYDPGDNSLRPMPVSTIGMVVTFKPYAADIPDVRNIQVEILPDDGSGQPLDWNEVKAANPWYFEALKRAAAIMPQRRAKYSGEDPFDNFERVARITGTSVAEAFHFDIALKLARLQVGKGDFEDESFNDCLKDLANYALLWCGYRLKKSGE